MTSTSRKSTRSTLTRIAMAGMTIAALAACPEKPPAVADAGPAKAEPPKPASSPRPPHPNMATAAWGQRVLEERASAATPAPAGTTLTTVLDALHEMTPGSEARAGELAIAVHRDAKTDQERGTSAALLAASLILDPTVEGYKERLTDAHGLAAYAGTLDASDSLGQSARAFVGAAAGSIEQAKRLVEVVATTPRLGSEPRLFLALARRLTGERGDAMIDDLRAALEARPTSARARALLAETWLELGLIPEALKESTIEGAAHPWLDAIRGRAMVLDGKVADGIALLKASEGKLDEGRRGDALYWLGRSLTQTDAPVAEVEAIASSLGARPGFAKEATVVRGLLAQKAGDYATARTTLEPIVKGPPGLPVDADAAWLLADACAGLGDLECVDRAASRAVILDGDEARVHLTRAAAALIGKAQLDPTQALLDAHRASPFDEGLAAKVGEPVVPGGNAAAVRVRAARRALLRKAPGLVDVALVPVAKAPACRVCRALDASAAAGIDAAQKAVKALDGEGPPLSIGDMMRVIDALGAAPIEPAKKSLDKLADDKREPVARAVTRARGDHKDPEARRRRDAGLAADAPEPSPKGAPGLPGAPGAPGHNHGDH